MTEADLLPHNIGIPRYRMPQLAGNPGPGSKAASLPRDPNFGGVDLGKVFWGQLCTEGHRLQHHDVSPEELCATQNELDMNKVHALCERIRHGMQIECLWVSSDRHIVDGHHRWAACVLAGVESVPVSQIDMPIRDVIEEALAFEKVWGPLK